MSPAHIFSHSHKKTKTTNINNNIKTQTKNQTKLNKKTKKFQITSFFSSSLKTFPSISSVSSLAIQPSLLLGHTLNLKIHLSSFENIHLWCLKEANAQYSLYCILLPFYKKGNPFLFSSTWYTLVINQAILTKIITEKVHATKN